MTGISCRSSDRKKPKKYHKKPKKTEKFRKKPKKPKKAEKYRKKPKKPNATANFKFGTGFFRFFSVFFGLQPPIIGQYRIQYTYRHVVSTVPRCIIGQYRIQYTYRHVVSTVPPMYYWTVQNTVHL